MKDKEKQIDTETEALIREYNILSQGFVKQEEKLIDNSWRAKMVEKGLYKDSEITSREKQIKEITRDICNTCQERHGCISDCRMCKFAAAEIILEKYQPKLPEDSVVLSREEYEKLKEDNKYLREMIDKFRKDNTDICKETAEKILKWLKGHLSCMGFSIVKAYFKEQFNVEIKE